MRLIAILIMSITIIIPVGQSVNNLLSNAGEKIEHINGGVP